MTDFLELDGGRIAYDVIGEGPLVVLAHGMGDNRGAYREVAAQLADAGYRVAKVDQRGHGESSTGWASYTRTDSAGDLLAVIRHLGGPAVLVGHSFAGGSPSLRTSPGTSPHSTPICAGPAGWQWWAGWSCLGPPTPALHSATSSAPL